MEVKFEDILFGVVRASENASMFVAGVRGERDFAACVQTLERAMRESTSIRDLVIFSIIPVLHESREAMDRFTQAELAYLDSMKSEGQQPGPQPNNKFKS